MVAAESPLSVITANDTMATHCKERKYVNNNNINIRDCHCFTVVACYWFIYSSTVAFTLFSIIRVRMASRDCMNCMPNHFASQEARRTDWQTNNPFRFTCGLNHPVHRPLMSASIVIFSLLHCSVVDAFLCAFTTINRHKMMIISGIISDCHFTYNVEEYLILSPLNMPLFMTRKTVHNHIPPNPIFFLFITIKSFF